MQASRIYLLLSIFALGVGSFFAVKETHCHRYECHVAQSKGHDTAMVYDALQVRDFDTMADLARDVIKHDRIDGYRLYGYAMRGQGNYELAEDAYTQCLRERPRRGDVPLILDAFIGRASARAAMGDLEGARNDLNDGMYLARRRAERRPDDAWARYQLACTYAVRWSALKDDTGDKDRAITELEAAMALGFAAYAHMAADLDLDGVRDDPRFQALFPSG